MAHSITFLNGDVAPVTSSENSSGTPGAGTSILYKFGMSPMLWGIVGAALAGGGYLLHRRGKKARR